MIPIPPFEEMEPELKRKVLKGDRLEAGRATSLKYLQGKYEYQENSEQLAVIFNLTNERLLNFTQIQDTELSKDLFWIRSEKYNAFGFEDYLHERYAPNKFSDSTFTINSREVFNDYILDLLVELEKSDLYQKNEDYRRLITEYEEGMLLFSIMEDKVWNQASIDTIGLKNYYLSNLDLYMVSDSAKLFVFDIDPAMQEAELEVLHQQQSLENKQGEQLWVNLSKWSATGFDDVFLQTDSDSMRAGIILEYSEERQQEFEEVKGKVISEYQDQLEREWIQQLNKDYTVKKNKKGIEIAVKQLAE